MKGLALHERLWGSLAHVPIITIIWTSYLAYCFYSSGTSLHIAMTSPSCLSLSSLPITPIIFTLLSIPISLSIMKLKRTSSFVYDNAQEAYFFNIWLLRSYFILFVIAVLGICCAYPYVITSAQIIGASISTFCFIQSFMGIVTSLQGRVFRYRYPGKKVIREQNS